jgi:hypothetical protein
MHILILRKCQYSDRYRSVDNLFQGEYTLSQLFDLFPESFFLVINEVMDYHNNRVVGVNRLKDLLLIDDDNQMHCQHCGTKNIVTRKYCRNCGYENKYYDVTKYLSPDFTKAADLRDFIDSFWSKR